MEKIKDGMFIQRIPKQRLETEDNSIKRICFSSSLRTCLSAIPGGIQIIKNLIYLSLEFHVAPLLYVYILDETLLPQENVMYPEQVKKYVVDAALTEEHWIINQNVICKEYLIGVLDFKYDYVMIPNEKAQIKYIKKLDYIMLNKIPYNTPRKFFKKMIKTPLCQILCSMDFKKLEKNDKILI